MRGVLEGGLGLEHNCHPTTKALQNMDVRTDCAPFFKLGLQIVDDCQQLFVGHLALTYQPGASDNHL